MRKSKPKLHSAQMGNQAVIFGAFAAIFFVFIVGAALLFMGNNSPSIGGCVGVVKISGPIMVDDVPGGIFSSGAGGSETIAKNILEANEREDVKALVLVIDSPGGSVVATREIYLALQEVTKPKIAYFREVAASGGYYIGAGADYIVSDPDTLTGSIGAKATFADLSGLFEKIGYRQTDIKSGELKDIGSPARPMTEKEKEIMQGIVDETFEEFKSVVIKGRGDRLDMKGFEEVLDARVLTGRQAERIGLVDRLGSKKDAIKLAASLAGDEELGTCEIGGSGGGLFSSLVGEMFGSVVPKAGIQSWNLRY